MNVNKGKLLIIGFGPGSTDHFTFRAKQAIAESDCILGYKTYVDLIADLITDQEVISAGMTEEVSRAQEAVRLAEQGRKVAVISSGDAGVYGMGGLVYEVLVEKGWTEETGVEVEIIPGISAINSCASLLGAPVMHDACTISLSDHLTPWKLIEKRIDAAAQADFVIALYNPRSGRRTRQIEETQRILLNYRSPNTPVGLVKSAYRQGQTVVITTLEKMLEHEIGMLTTVIIGNSSTFMYDNKIITPRGYQRKYTLSSEEQQLKPHERLKKEAEPWALEQIDPSDRYEQDEALAMQQSKAQIAATIQPVSTTTTSRQLAEEALSLIQGTNQELQQTPFINQKVESIFEVAVSPGVVNKKFTPAQMMTLAELVGENGTMEYTPHHQILLNISTINPNEIVEKLTSVGFLVSPVGDFVNVKACDFCNGEKQDAIPMAEELNRIFGGKKAPKEMNIGINGCGMACYGAVNEDIGIVHRKGKYDLFLGAKPVGRSAHAGQIVEEGIEPDKLIETISRVIDEYFTNGHPNERFFKFFKRVKQIHNYPYVNIEPKLEITPAPCGD